MDGKSRLLMAKSNRATGTYLLDVAKPCYSWCAFNTTVLIANVFRKNPFPLQRAKVGREKLEA